MKMRYIALLALAVVLCVAPASAILTDYEHSVKITFDKASSTLTNHQVNFTVHRSSGTNTGWDIYVGTDCQDDYDDIRFTKGDGTDTLLDCWIDVEDYSTSSARIWVEVPTISSTEETIIIMYYGYSSATSVSNGTNTFDFFDDFGGASIDATKWTTSGATVGVSSGILTVTGTASSWQGVYSNTGLYSSTVMRVKTMLKTHTSGNVGVGYTDVLSEPPADYYIEFYQYYDSGYKLKHYTKKEAATSASDAINSDNTNYYIYDEKRASTDSSILYIDNVYADTRALGAPGTLPVAIATYYSGSQVLVDYLYVYKISSTPPSVKSYGDLITTTGDATYIVDGYTIVEFLSPYSVWVVPPNVDEVDYVIVGGGGGGGCKWAGGGGGGGVLEGTSHDVSGYGGYIDVMVGAGGIGSSDDEARGASGGNSSFGTLNATGGGGGASTGSAIGLPGGSGGGGAFGYSGGSGVSGQGYDGGAGTTDYDCHGGGGGGGAGEAGAAGTGTRGGKGGDGKMSTISGIPKVYGGGGGGGALEPVHPGEPGAGGGGQGGWSETYTRAGTDGADGWGGGGGGGGADTYKGGDGGSGTVVIRYVYNVSASFTSNVTSGVIPLTVQFNDTSSGFPTSWNWDFGDGNTSIEQNPVHTYESYGYYDVTLEGANAFSTNTTVSNDYIVTIDKFSFDYAKYINIVGTTDDQYYYEIPVYVWDAAGTDSGDIIYLGGSNATSTWSDIRFSALNSDGNRVGVEYWIEESNATYAKIWMSVPYIEKSTTTHVSMYYDNTDITRNQSDGRRTFLFFDDFEDGTLFNWNTTTGYEWEVVTSNVKSGTYSARGRNWLYQDNSGGGLRVYTDRFGNKFGNSTIEWDFRFESAGTETCAGFYMIPFIDGNYTYPYQMMDVGYVVYNDGPGVNEEHWTGSGQYSTSTWYSGRLTHNFDNTTKDAWIDSTYLGQRPLTYFNAGNTYPTSSMDLMFHVSTTYLYGNPIYLWMDNVKVRKFFYPEPYLDGTSEMTSPMANFSATPLTGYPPLEVTFTDDSSNTTSWAWDFGDGSEINTTQHPVHIYTGYGLFNVSLRAFGEEWYDDEVKVDYINITCNSTPLESAFTANVTSGDTPLWIQFTDQSDGSATSWNWSFGDGEYSDTQNPIHIYTSYGVYNVTLNATSDAHCSFVPETKLDYITAEEPPTSPVADFTANVTYGYPEFTVAFTDTSTNNPTTWNWSFPNGGDAHTANATWTFDYVIGNTPTSYEISLYVSNDDGNDTETKTGYITAYPLNASFTTATVSGCSPLSVVFTDQTNNGTPTTWYWTFGDGNTSVDQNPTHEYTGIGSYTVTLNASNVYSYDLYTKTNLITVTGAPPVANFSAAPTTGDYPLTVVFTDDSSNTPTSFYWGFGDGVTSTDENPTHIYNASAWYTITHYVSNDCGGDWENKTYYITVGLPATPTPTPTPTPSPTPSTAPGYRTRATATIAMLNVTRYDELLESIEGVEPDWGEAIDSLLGTYTDIGGPIAIIILLAIPFIMMWLMQGRVVIPATIGIILSYIVGVYMPVEYKPITTIFIVLYIISIVWAILRDR